MQAKDRELREKQTVRDELTRKERELAGTQQQLRQKVNIVITAGCVMFCY